MSDALTTRWPADKRLVLGVGCGRTGSESLGYLLDVQPDGCVSHEFSLFCEHGHRSAARYRVPLGWKADRAEVSEAVVALSRYPGKIVGDVASYWLPQLSWILEEVPNACVIGITRNREAVVRSFLEKSGSSHHWAQHDGKTWTPDPTWDPAFPKYDVSEKEEAIGLYWDDYYAECDRLAAKYPDRFRLWPLPALSDPHSAKEMLLFAGHDPDRLNLKQLAPRNKKKSRLRKMAKRILRRGEGS